jgi:hypothetical protein
MPKSCIRFSPITLATLAALALLTPVQAQGIKLLPNDSEVVISVNMKQVWGSKLVKDYNATFKQLQSLFNTKLEDNQIAKEIKDSLGIDPFRDIDVVTIGMSDMGKNPKNVVVVLDGNFNTTKFADTATKAAKENPEVVKAMSIGQQNVYAISPPGDDPFYMAMLNKNTLVIAKTKEGMTSAIQPPAQNLKKELADLMQTANLKKSLNFVATAAALQEAIKQGNNPQAQVIEPFLKDLNGTVVTANVVSDIELFVGYVTKDAASAQRMAEETNKGLAAMKVLVGNQAKLQPVADIMQTLKVSAQGNSMNITGRVPRKVLDDAITKIENFLP